METLDLRLSHAQKHYDRPVLTDINLTMDNSSYIAVLGRSGCGKSTLMNILGLVEERSGGGFTFNGKEIRKGRDYASFRRKHIGFIFQSYHLIPTLTCLENIRMPLLYQGGGSEDRSEEWICRLELEKLLHQRVNTLSGGEKQRVAIARALILEPCLILADEPTGNLDEKSSEIVFRILNEESNRGRGILMITHSAKAAAQAKQILYLREGALHETP